MALVKEISSMSEKKKSYRTVHYISGICSAFYMKEAMDMAMKSNAFSGEEIRNAMYAKENWVPAGLEGVCLPSSWKEDDHRGLMEVPIYRVKVNGSTEKKKVDELMREKIIELVKEDQIELPRRPEWRGY